MSKIFSSFILFTTFAVATIHSGGFLLGQDNNDSKLEDDRKSEEKTQEEESAEDSDSKTDSETGIDAAKLSALKFRSIGPALMSGRIADIAIDPVSPNTWYIAVGSGGVWKTENAGTTWTPIFDNYSSYSIGCVTIDPNNHNNIWVGTGENVAGRHVGFGDGVYFSNDAGGSFKNLGLNKTEHISKIVVHPKNSNIVYVAAQGPLWSSGGERGLYKTTDGGTSWSQVLSKGEYTGVTDVAIHPGNPNIIYAATYQKHRTVWALMSGGPESGIHKSIDGGKTWTELTGGIPGESKGKISVAVSPQNHEVVYATIELSAQSGGFFRSDDGGVSFAKMSDYVGGGTGPHYYQEIWCDPHRFDSIYHANVVLGRSDDGGRNFEGIGNNAKHVDNHAVAFHPLDPNTFVVGCDGGLYVSHDRGQTYRFTSNLPLTQFYKLALDNDFPFYNVVGGTQDNNTQYGPTATNRAQGIANRDWRVVIGGDGHDCAIDPEDSNIIYGESQQGYLRRYDRLTGETVDIRPQPERGETELRFNWDSPIEISFHDHKRLYFGSKKLHRSDDRGDSWAAISPDLSRNQNRLTLPIMGGFWSIDDSWDLFAMSEYNNITSIGESPLDEKLIYVGTDDGLIQVTEDGGENWRKIDLISGLPETAFVNDIKACHHEKDTVFVCFDNHKYGDYKPYVMKSTDRGNSWAMITDGLPEKHLCWRIIQDHEKADLLFLATEFGVFATLDSGKNWFKFSHGLPTISFRDLEIQRRENDLVGATFGRGFYVLDDYSPLREVNPGLFSEKDFHLFAIKDAKQFPQADFLGGPQGSQGNGYFNAENPAYGAVFTYFNKEGFKSAESIRKEKEKTAKEQNKAVPLPGVEDLAKEDQETEPELVFTIADETGNVVRRLNHPVSEGMHRINWDLRNHDGPYVAPGAYTVTVDHVHDGVVKSLAEATTFNIVACIEPTLPIENRADVLGFYDELNKFQNQMRSAQSSLTEAGDKLTEAEEAIARDDEAHFELLKELKVLKARHAELDQAFTGSAYDERIGLETKASVFQRMRNASGSMYSLSGPTKTHRESLEIARELYAELQPGLAEFVDNEVKSFIEKARDAGVEGISGGPIPDLDD